MPEREEGLRTLVRSDKVVNGVSYWVDLSL